MSKLSPGPWKCAAVGEDIAIADASGDSVLSTSHSHYGEMGLVFKDRTHQQAILAVPEMVELLREMLDGLVSGKVQSGTFHTGDWKDRARAILKRIDGEP